MARRCHCDRALRELEKNSDAFRNVLLDSIRHGHLRTLLMCVQGPGSVRRPPTPRDDGRTAIFGFGSSEECRSIDHWVLGIQAWNRGGALRHFGGGIAATLGGRPELLTSGADPAIPRASIQLPAAASQRARGRHLDKVRPRAALVTPPPAAGLDAQAANGGAAVRARDGSP
jgi:hypothetical protein